MTRKEKYAIVFISVLLLVWPAGAQSDPNGTATEQHPYRKFSPSMVVIIVVLIFALFFIGFFSAYIRHCTEGTPGGSVRRLGASMRRRAAAGRGLDPEVIETFPTFLYSAVKGRKIGKGALECAVCLNEFEDDETLRLLPKCDHVFHPECIDAWLSAHVTCPVCRSNLVPQPGETLQHPDLVEPVETEQPNDDVCIRVVDDEEVPIPPQVVDRNRSVNQNRPPRSRSVRARLFGKFPRSHSTGHSLVQPGANMERFTLRLPEDVRKQVMSYQLSRTTSCSVALPRESSSRRGYRTNLGEGSSRGGRSYKGFEHVDRGVRSDRWAFSIAPPFFTRAPSVRSATVVAASSGAEGEGSTSLTASRDSRTAVKSPSFKSLKPTGDKTSLGSADLAPPPVQRSNSFGFPM